MDIVIILAALVFSPAVAVVALVLVFLFCGDPTTGESDDNTLK